MKHNCKEFWRLVKKASENGFRVTSQGQKVVVKSSKTNEMILLHASDRAFHPLRRWLKNEGIAA